MSGTTILFSNNAQSTLAGSITNVALTAQLAAGTGVLFPAPGAGEYFVLTFIDQATGLVNEIVHVTDVTGDVITMVRGQEGTTPLAWTAGDIAANLMTAGTAEAFTQFNQAQSQAMNYAVDTGIVNAYVCALSPPLTAVVAGMPIRVKIATANTGPSTLNPGPGALPIINPDGTALGSGTFSAGGVYTFEADGAGHYQLVSASNAALSSSGIATTGAWTWRATAENISGWIFANATTIGNAASNGTQRANADTQNLFAWHWTNFSNTQCPVFTSGGVPTTRGASAAADFAANKQIQVLDLKGYTIVGCDTMGGGATTRLSGVPAVSGNATTPGSVLGENLHPLTIAELAAHGHAITDPGHSHVYNSMFTLGAFNVQLGGSSIGGNTSTSSVTTGITVNNSGSGQAHNTVQFSMTGYHYLKL